MKQVFVLVLVLCLWAASPVWAATSLDFLKTNPLYDEKVIDYQTAAITANILELSGRDITFLKYQINRIVPKDLASRIYYIMATKNTSVATEIAAAQNSNGSWNNDVGLTALACLSLIKVDTTSATVTNGINYIQSNQNPDGGRTTTTGSYSSACAANTNRAYGTIADRSGYASATACNTAATSGNKEGFCAARG